MRQAASQKGTKPCQQLENNGGGIQNLQSYDYILSRDRHNVKLIRVYNFMQNTSFFEISCGQK